MVISVLLSLLLFSLLIEQLGLMSDTGTAEVVKSHFHKTFSASISPQKTFEWANASCATITPVPEPPAPMSVFAHRLHEKPFFLQSATTVLNMIWQNVKASPSPVKRHGACMASVDNRLLLFGGRSSGLCSCEEIHMYDSLQRLGKGEWRVLRASGGPAPRTLAQICELPGARLLLYGGEGADGMLEDCWILHTRDAGEQSLSDMDIGLISAGGYREAVARLLPGTSSVSSPSKAVAAPSADGDSEDAPSTRSHQLFLKMQSSDFSAISDASAPGSAAPAQVKRPDCKPLWQPLRSQRPDPVSAALAAVAADPEDEYCSEHITAPSLPGRKTGHSLAFFPGAGALMFGGVGSDQVPTNELWNIQVAVGSGAVGRVKFSRVAALGTPPAPRAFHGCCSHFANMIIVGGEDSCVLGDLHVLDTSSMTWSQPLLPVPLPPAKALQLSLVGDHLIIFGGEDRSYQPSNCATLYHIGHSQSTALVVSPPLLSLTGDPPLPRHSHAGCGTGGLVIWGGQGEHFYGDLWMAAENAEEKKVRARVKRVTVFLLMHAREQARETAEQSQRCIAPLFCNSLMIYSIPTGSGCAISCPVIKAKMYQCRHFNQHAVAPTQHRVQRLVPQYKRTRCPTHDLVPKRT